MPPPSYDALVAALLAGDPGGWHQFWAAIEPRLELLLRRPSFLGPLAHDPDHRRAVAVEVLARLQKDDHARLRGWWAARQAGGGELLAWLAVVARRLAIDHLRGQPEYEDRRREAGASAKGRWHAGETLPSAGKLPAARPSITNLAEARRLGELAAILLSAEQQDALGRWLRGEPWEQIARALGLRTDRDAERLVRAGLERLRRHIRKEEGR